MNAWIPKLTATRHPCRLGKMVTSGRRAGSSWTRNTCKASSRTQSILENLHRELASADSIDEESRVLLQDLAQDVERLAGDADAADVEHESTAGQLQNAALRFESDHPKLAMAVGEVIDALSKLGI